MALLVLGDLGIAVGRHVAHDDWNFMQSGSDRRAQSLGTEVDAVAAVNIGRVDDERLQDAAQPDVGGEFSEREFGELGSRIARVFVKASGRHEQGPTRNRDAGGRSIPRRQCRQCRLR